MLKRMWEASRKEYALMYKVVCLFWSIKCFLPYKSGHRFTSKKPNMARDLSCLLGYISWFDFISSPLKCP